MSKHKHSSIPPTAASLTDVSKRDTVDVSERRRLPRLNLSGEQFRLSQNGKIFSVVDLSPSGMALRILVPADLGFFSVAARVQGQLNLKREKHPITAAVRHVRVDSIGCEFENLSPETEAALKNFLDPEILGKELRPIPASSQGGQATLWYHGPSGTDLLFWRGWDGQYHKVALYVQGSYIQWDAAAPGKGLSTGRTESSAVRSEVQGILRVETLLLHPDPKPDSGKLNVARALMSSSSIPQDLKSWCLRKLESKMENKHGS